MSLLRGMETLKWAQALLIIFFIRSRMNPLRSTTFETEVISPHDGHTMFDSRMFILPTNWF